jgi:hypothetical protein
MKSWEDIVKSGIVPEAYVRETTPGMKTGRSEHFFLGMSPEEADTQGRKINQAIAQAKGLPADEGTPAYMKREWNWSDESLAKASTFFHTAPDHARPHIEVNGIRPNLTSTVGNPREMKQRYGLFGSKHSPEISYGLDPAHPDESGTKRADVYKISIPTADLRIDPYGYSGTDRTVKPHEFERVGHAIQRQGELRGEYHEGKAETCTTCGAK